MFTKIIGYFLVFFGIFFLIKPALLKNRLQKKAARKIRKYLFLASLILGVMLISAAWKHHGLLPKLILIIGIIFIFKGFYFLKSQSSEKVVEVIIKQPVLYFRIYAALQIAIGLAMLFVV